MKHADMIRENRKLGSEMTGDPYVISLVSNTVVFHLIDVLEYELRQHGINAKVMAADFNTLVLDASAWKGIDACIVFWEIGALGDKLAYEPDTRSASKKSELIDTTINEMGYFFSSVPDRTLILFNLFDSRSFRPSAIGLDFLDLAAEELNGYLRSLNHENLQLIDTSRVATELTAAEKYDMRAFFRSSALYSIDFLIHYAQAVKPVFLSLFGKSKKAIIFDCDNTLWRGVVGEDGLDGLRMAAHQADGACFHAVQEMAIELSRRGVIIGLCSKNNPEDVEEVLTTHPDMVLANEHVTIKKVNWSDKASNLREIARDLNIGLDSLVFVDDSDYEVNLIRELVPEVLVLKVPDQVSDYPGMIRQAFDLFYQRRLGTEDNKRTQYYSEEQTRQKQKVRFSSVDDYVRSLGLEISMSWNPVTELDRIAQITQKTNQFNLTTKRYSSADIQAFLKSEDVDILLVSASDKFGSYGSTGLLIQKNIPGEKSVFIDTFALSCRILNRHIEWKLFDEFINNLIKKGINTIRASYIPTKKNQQVSNFYDNLGFDLDIENNGEKHYSLPVKKYKPKNIDYIEVKDGRAN